MSIKPILLVVAISITVSLLSNLFLGTRTESSIWKKTAIEKIGEVSFLRNADRNAAVVIQNMMGELEALDIGKVDTVLQKYRVK